MITLIYLYKANLTTQSVKNILRSQGLQRCCNAKDKETEVGQGEQKVISAEP